MRAILSVWDKARIVDFAKGLLELGFELVSTGGTKRTLSGANIPVKSVEDLTGFPEILDGRVKSLHPKIHGGILAKRNKINHLEQLKKANVETIDLVAVNLYPFIQTVEKVDVSLEEALENIDIGGPTLIRAAAKNFPDVVVVVDPKDYDKVLELLYRGNLGLKERKMLAEKAFRHTAFYDAAITRYLSESEDFADEMTIGLKKKSNLRYGENPHQKAVFYEEVLPTWKGISEAKQLWGKELSYNNIMDADGAWNAVIEFEEPTVAIIKHTNPCGLASHKNPDEAFRRAYSGDPVSAYGGIVAANRTVDKKMAEEVAKIFFEIIIAPDFEEEALNVLQTKKNLRILKMGTAKASSSGLDFRRVAGGFLVQTRDVGVENATWKSVAERNPTEEELKNLKFAWKAVKFVKSNAIVVAKDSTLLGMGAGQPSRVDSAEIALKKAGERAKGAVLASDAFFPFADGVEIAAKGGITAIVQPGGSVRDKESVEMANKHNLAMIFTGMRHFRH